MSLLRITSLLLLLASQSLGSNPGYAASRLTSPASARPLPSLPATSADPAPIYITTTPEVIRAGEPFLLEIHVGSETTPVENLFGLSFELRYSSPEFLTLDGPDSSALIPGPFLGNDLTYVLVSDRSSGLINAGITRNAPSDNVSGRGVVFQARFITDDAIPDSTLISFAFNRYTARDKDGNAIELVPLERATYVVRPVDFHLRIEPRTRKIPQGKEGSFSIEVVPAGGFNKRVSLSFSADPAGLSSSLSRNEIAPGERALLTIQVDSLAEPGNYTYGITAVSDTIRHRDSLTVEVITTPIYPTSASSEVVSGDDFWIDIVAGDASSPVENLARIDFVLAYDPANFVRLLATDSGSVVPGPFLGDDASLSFASDARTGEVRISAATATASSGVSGSGVVARIRLGSILATPDGTILLFSIDDVDARDPGGRRIVLTPEDFELTVREQLNFALQVEPEAATVVAGETAEFRVALNTTASFDARVAISVSGAPARTVPAVTPASIVRNDTATIAIATDTSTASGSYDIKVTGTGGGLQREKTVRLVILPATSFQIVITPPAQSIFPGDSAEYTISVETPSTLYRPIHLEALGIDDVRWARGRLSPAQIDAVTTSRLVIQTTDDAKPGRLAFTVIGRSGGSTDSETGELVILEPPPAVRPNPFTPNNDGFNDFVLFDFEELKRQPGEILIFDANGRKVVELTGTNRWDGTDRNGKVVQPGAYLYIVRINNQVLDKGVIGLAR